VIKASQKPIGDEQVLMDGARLLIGGKRPLHGDDRQRIDRVQMSVDH
jgi:hypothetical protein